ncbi:MAG: hypothetical protein FWC32_14100 [Firmicutes bacterium]|nr:hypothetical protein [Bacillota bacterium]
MQYETEIKTLEKLLWEFGLVDAVSNIQATPAEGDDNPALICIIKKGNSSKVIATVFNEYDYFPKYAVIRERFQESHPNVDVKYLI